MADQKVLVVGLGNPILGDDGIGWVVAEEVRGRLDNPLVDVECLALGGMRLMEMLIGYDRAIVVDAVLTHSQPVGNVSCLPLEELPDLTAGHTSSAHDTSLQTALQIGRRMGLPLPKTITVVGVEALQVYDFSEQLSQPVQNAIPQAVECVLGLLDG